MKNEQAELMLLAQHLLQEVLDQDTFPRCDLTSKERPQERCRNKANAVRWEDGFADYVCAAHAASATERRALVITPRRHNHVSPDPKGEKDV